MLDNNDSAVYYKYRNFNEMKFLIDILENNRLFASDFDKFNDPMDSFFEHYKETDKFLKGIKETKLKNKILSLCKSPNNILMWTHYADEHKGMVIGVEIIDEEVSVSSVKYCSELPLLNERKKNNQDEYPQKYQKQFVKKVLTSKLNPWRYEEEVRVLSKESFINIQIKQVIFGLKTSEQCKNTIKNLFSKEKQQDKNFFKEMRLNDLDTSFTFGKLK